MEREDYVKICRTCEHRAMSAKHGLYCGLTDELPSFDEECPDFKQDWKAKEKEIFSEIRASEPSWLEAVELAGDIEDSEQNTKKLRTMGVILVVLGVVLGLVGLVANGSYVAFAGLIFGAGLVVMTRADKLDKAIEKLAEQKKKIEGNEDGN